MIMQTFQSVDSYIDSFPKDIQMMLKKLRKLILDIVPEATEDMSYKMPSYKLNKKPLIYFAAWKDHISLYPTPNAIEALKEDLKPYATGKGTLQFSLEKPLPIELIVKLIKLRVLQNNKK